MAETMRRCEAHGSDWYRDWCVMIEIARREGHRVVDLDPCRLVEGVWSAPGELVDPANVDFEAAARRLEQKQTVARGRFRLDEADAADIVDAALGVGSQ